MDKEQARTATKSYFTSEIYRGFTETGADIGQATIHHADGTQSLEFTLIPLQVWQHIGIDGQALIDTVRAKRGANQ